MSIKLTLADAILELPERPATVLMATSVSPQAEQVRRMGSLVERNESLNWYKE